MFATRARRNVENARLMLDAAKTKAKSGGRGMNPDDESLSEEGRVQVEHAEDEFVGQTEEAVGVMKNVRLSTVMTVDVLLTISRCLIPRSL